jgi:hypothetical protein
MHPAQQLQRLAFERMAWAGDGYLGGKTLEVGSVSCFPLVTSITTGCWRG